MAGYYRKDDWGWPDVGGAGGTLYSPDLGHSWQHTAQIDGVPGVLYVGKNAGGDPVTLLIGSSDAILQVSTDRGQHWAWISGADRMVRGITSIAWNQVEGPGSVILALQFSGPGSVWRSTDQGQSWSIVRPWDIRQVNNSYGDWPIAVAISPQNEVLLILEHSFRGKSCPWGGYSAVLYRSLDAGDTWEEANDPTGLPDPCDTDWDPRGRKAVGVAYLGGPESIP